MLYKSFIKNQEARSSKENTGNVWQGEYAGSTKTKCTFIRSFLQWIFQCFSYILQVNNNRSYYSFKIFSLFWLVKTTHIIHHNQLLFTKFGKNLRHIESMTSKEEPSENYWTNDVKIFAILNKWRQKYSPPQIIEPLTEKTWGQGCVIFGKRKNKERNGETPLRRRKYFEWIIKQLLNSAFVGYEEFCRSRRVLSASAFGLCG